MTKAIGTVVVLAGLAFGCGSTQDGTDTQAGCPQAFFVDAADAGPEGTSFTDSQCAALCGKAVFSCAVASVDGGTDSIECQPSCDQNALTK